MTKNCSILLRVGLALVLCVVATVPAWAQSETCVLFVDGDAPGIVQDGLAWETAFRDLQDALAGSRPCVPAEIRIAQGVYKPSPFDGSREDSFLVRDGVSLFGGFAGLGEPDPDERDPDRFETVLSGDLLGNDDADISTLEDNSYHVITLDEGSRSTVFDGLTVTAGYANGLSQEGRGGGLFAGNAEFTLRKSKFIGNRARISGGAVFSAFGDFHAVDCDFVGNRSRDGGAMSIDDSQATLTDCRFQKNHASDEGGAIKGAGLALLNCDFEENRADYLGGAIKGAARVSSCRFFRNSAPLGGAVFAVPNLVRDCVFLENYASVAGGALYIDAFDARILNCEFVLNRSGNFGGALYFSTAENTLVGNCLFLANWAGEGAGIHVDSAVTTDPGCTVAGCTIAGNRNTVLDSRGAGILVSHRGNARVSNTILWDNQSAGFSDQQTQVHVSGFDASLQVDFSIVEGLTSLGGVGNIGDDPLFIVPGFWDDNATPNFIWDDVWVDGDFRLSPGSPAIDAGTNDAVPFDVTTDLDGLPRIVDDPATPNPGGSPEAIVDIGAYEFQPVPPVEAFLDILPGDCPNILHLRKNGVIKVALLGTDEFDAAAVDPDSLLLSRTDGTGGSVGPILRPPGLAPKLRDVATPFVGLPCDCHQRRRDGSDDLLLRYSVPALVQELHLDSVPAGVPISLTLHGAFQDGTTFSAVDCVLSRHGKAPRRSGHSGR